MTDITDDREYIEELRGRIKGLEEQLHQQAHDASTLLHERDEYIEQLERKAQGLENAGEYLAEELRLTREAAYLVGNMGSEDLNNKIAALRDAGRNGKP